MYIEFAKKPVSCFYAVFTAAIHRGIVKLYSLPPAVEKNVKCLYFY